MDYLPVYLAPALLEESWRELERERQRQRQRQIQEARAARRAERPSPSHFATLTARVRHALQRNPCPQLAEDC